MNHTMNIFKKERSSPSLGHLCWSITRISLESSGTSHGSFVLISNLFNFFNLKVTHHVLLCDPMDCIVHGLLQARIPFFMGSSQPRNRTAVSCSNLWQAANCVPSEKLSPWYDVYKSLEHLHRWHHVCWFEIQIPGDHIQRFWYRRLEWNSVTCL